MVHVSSLNVCTYFLAPFWIGARRYQPVYTCTRHMNQWHLYVIIHWHHCTHRVDSSLLRAATCTPNSIKHFSNRAAFFFSILLKTLYLFNEPIKRLPCRKCITDSKKFRDNDSTNHVTWNYNNLIGQFANWKVQKLRSCVHTHNGQNVSTLNTWKLSVISSWHPVACFNRTTVAQQMKTHGL